MSISKMTSLSLVVFSIVVSFCMTKHDGFSTKLYRRDFPGSPSYDPTLSLGERVSKAMDRSIGRYNRSAITPNSPKSSVMYHKPEYLMKIALGTPPEEMFVVMDTGSTLTWTQCTPCQRCFQQITPLFNPIDSSTYRKIKCIHRTVPCPNFVDPDGCESNVCTYNYGYADGTKTCGDLSIDTLTMESTTDQPVRQSNYIFGCGFRNEGLFSPESTGMIGLGHGSKWAFVHQLDNIIKGKFSYCLVPNLAGSDKLSTINFGKNAILRGPGVFSTPLIAKAFHYYVTLKALTIAGERVEFSSNFGNIIIDSGTTLNHYPTFFYKKVLSAFARRTNGRSVSDPDHRFPLCYDYEGLSIPDVIANFAGGADISLNFDNLFIETPSRLACLAIGEAREDRGDVPIWGNIAQTNYLVGFDLYDEILSFKRANCENI